MTKKDPHRYKPRHAWYLADAFLLIQQLQAVLWPRAWHVALGGGVLNHGYSNNDLDLYVLPLYSRPGEATEEEAIALVSAVIGGGIEPVCSLQDAPHDCFSSSVRFTDAKGRQIEVFITRRDPSQMEAK